MTNYSRHFQVGNTSQTEQAKPEQIKNRAGGFVFGLDKWTQLQRFLILGSEGNTYYSKERELVADNAKNVVACIREDGKRTVGEIVTISDSGRAPRNDPAIFALSLCLSKDVADKETRQTAAKAVPKVCRIGTHIFKLAQYIDDNAGWGRVQRRAVGNYYHSKLNDRLAYDLVKYRQRDGWTHRDVLLLGHVKPDDSLTDMLYGYAVNGKDIPNIRIVEGYEKIKRISKPKEAAKIIADYKLTREMVPTELLRSAEVWEALFQDMPYTAMIRNLGKLGAIGLLKTNLDKFAIEVCSRITEEKRIKKSRIHPLNLYVAYETYGIGEGLRGSLSWPIVPNVCDAMEDAFYQSFDNVESTGLRWNLACDVSGSMWHGNMSGFPVSPGEVTGVLAMVTARKEPSHMITAFSHEYREVNISPRARISEIKQQLYDDDFGGTDCSLPVMHALQNELPIDVFVIYTDSETWYGSIHPFEALKKYRDRMQIPAKLIVVGLESSGFTIADPSDAGMLDIVGFDTAMPQIISEFVNREGIRTETN